MILPIWHNITEDQMIASVPSLADKVARDTSVHSIDAIADEIAEIVRVQKMLPNEESS